jgi:hypothetical protein
MIPTSSAYRIKTREYKKLDKAFNIMALHFK